MKRNVMIILIFMISNSLKSATFHTKEIQRIFNLLNINENHELNNLKDTLLSINLTKSTENPGIHILIKNSEIYNIGIAVFPGSFFYSPASEMYQFIERKMLYYVLVNHKDSISKDLIMSSAFLALNGKNFGDSFFNESKLLRQFFEDSINCKVTSDSIKTIATFNNNNSHLVFAFKRNYFTITGLNKIEADSYLFASIEQVSNKSQIMPLQIDDTHNLVQINDSIFIVKGNTYFKSITANYFVTKSDSGFQTLFGSDYKTESFINSILIPDEIPNSSIVTLKHKQYHGIKTVSTSMAGLIAFLKVTHELYFGVEDTASNHIAGTLIAYNKELNYLHVLYFITTQDALFSKEPAYTCELYSFVATDNIKNLFSAYTDNGYKYLIKGKK